MSSPALAKKANHQANVVRLGEPRVHTNADTLELFDIEGYQVVVKKGTFKAGDLAVYIQPDSVIPQTEPFKFIWEPFAPQSYLDEGKDFDCPERKRRITVRRFRKEWSEGLLMPLNEFPEWSMDPVYSEGSDVSDLIGVTHYVPEFDVESTQADTSANPKRRYPKSLKGWFFFLLYKLGFQRSERLAQEVDFSLPTYHVDALKNNKSKIQDGDLVQVTEKIHGSNARYVFIDGVFYAGSHEQWKQRGDNVWWNAVAKYPQIEEFCTQNPGKMLVGEVGPTQKGWRYGAEDGETFFFAFDVFDPTTNTWTWAGNEGFVPTVPVLYVGPYSSYVLTLADGPSVVPGETKDREGVVVRILKETASKNRKLKIVSNKFLEKDSK